MKQAKENGAKENGNVLFMILIAVVLLGALTYTMSRNAGDQNASSINSERLAEELKTQAQLIRSSILECVLVHNFGYPGTDQEGYKLKDLECQTNDNPVERKIIFSSDRVLPPMPKPFDEWTYHNDGGGGISIVAQASTVTANVISALQKFKSGYADSEVDKVDPNGGLVFLWLTKP